MSYLGRVKRKVRRRVERLKINPIVAVRGFGVDRVYVFDESICTNEEAERNRQRYQAGVDADRYKSIEDFDSFHTADLEFSHIYHGKKRLQWNKFVKGQLVQLGVAWRTQIEKLDAHSEVTIVVHLSDGFWFLDTFNYRVTEKHTFAEAVLL